MICEEELIFKINRKTFASLFFIAILFFGTLSFLLQWENKKQIKILGPGNIIDHEFDISKLNTDFWYFSGGTGTKTRKVTLPSIEIKSKNEKNVRQVKILFLN